MKIFFALSFILFVLNQTPLISSDELEVFAVVRSIFDLLDLVLNQYSEVMYDLFKKTSSIINICFISCRM